MGSEYDRKFEEMKKYIPFLESMIKRLESTSSSSNPRQAQLDKIRSLRDLLLDKKKRMKMDNLLKCEQVLVNLYAKVEQKDTLPAAKTEDMESGKDNSDLEAVRNKLKTVAKMQNVAETLPEIARASEIEEICEPGSKEPALFQRRPNRSSVSPVKQSPVKPPETKVSPQQQSRRSQYTRVLLSPPRTSRWPKSEESSTDKPLFSRRSPRRSPRRNSPSYHKKERKKPSKSKDGKSRKDLNITLKVPEESLNSLNTEDILSRIITCSDGDVDIDTLRELRSQILGELKQTGSNDDISELILKSYNKKSKSKKKSKLEVEEGEISDSESEVIENVYGSLVVMDKDKKTGQAKTAAEKNSQQRKIQICLVINSDKDGETKPVKLDLSASGTFENNKDVICLDSDASPSPNKNAKPVIKESQNPQLLENIQTVHDALSETKITGEGESIKSETNPILESLKKESHMIQGTPSKMMDSTSEILKSRSPSPVKPLDEKPKEPVQNIANFYKPHPESSEVAQSNSNIAKPESTNESQKAENANHSATANLPVNDQDLAKKKDDTVEIPLLNEPTLPPKAPKKDVLSEIDILQALKNEILSETIPMANEVDTPALHQPKLSKVASSAEAGTLQPKTMKEQPPSSAEISKKRISIENYKKKSETVAKSLFVKKRSFAEREAMKKQSLKLTEKECERFNFPARLSLDDDDDISDDDLLDEDKPLSLNDIYAKLAPKSPDQNNYSDDIDSPIVIPVEPIKSPVFTSKTDVDLRTPIPPQPVPPPVGFTNNAPSVSTEISKPPSFDPNKVIPDVNRKPLVDPRLRRDLSQPASRDNPNSYGATNIEGTPRPSQFPNISPLLAPIYTPSYAPSVTPIRTPNARSFEMTPNHQSFEIDEPQQKHVYAPSFSMSERDLSVGRDRPVWEPNMCNDDQRSGRDTRKPRWEKGGSIQRDPQSHYNQRNDKYLVDRRDGYHQSECPPTPNPSFGWSEGPSKPALLETPVTPSHPFGRSDCPPTPSHPFGRSDCPPTPNHPFGRSECPPTPIHPFGRSDSSSKPPLLDNPMTPSHHFGRSDCPPTPSHPFGRSDYKDPRLNRRQSDYDPRMHDDRDRGFQNEPGYNRNSYKSHSRPYGGSDSPRNFEREHHYGRNDRYSNEHSSRYSKANYSERPSRYESMSRSEKSYYNEPSDRSFYRERRDPSQNRTMRDDVRETSQLFTRNRDGQYESKHSHGNEDITSRSRYLEKNSSRTIPGEFIRSNSLSVNRAECNESPAKPQSDRAFTIDTSVNTTFQNLIESGKGIQVFDYSFDARRQRASSVGRSLAREGSVGRTLSHRTLPKETHSTESPCFQRRNNFQRASSVGRVLATDKKERSLQEIKAEFESYRLSSKDVSMKTQIFTKNAKPESRSRKDDFDKYSRSLKNVTKQPYSPRKNYRDPRNNKNDRSHNNSWDRRHSGISYSNDNIAKGTIMGSGFGVKNYKIPKIKRPEPEPPKKPVENVIIESEKNITSSPKQDTDKNIKTTVKKDTKKTSDEDMTLKIKTKSGKTTKVDKSNEKKDKDNSSDDGSVNKIKVSKHKDSKVVIISDDDCDKRVTRSRKKIDNLKEEPNKKTKRIKKPVIEDSESDDETDLKTLYERSKIIKDSEVTTKQTSNEVSSIKIQLNDSKDPSNATPKKITEKPTQKSNTEKPIAEKELRKNVEEDRDLDSSFAIDDLEMFSDNIVSDPVIDNINDLIADLDSDIGNVKSANNSFSVDMEKMIDTIDSQEENTLGDISDLIEKDLNESNEQLKQIVTQRDDALLNEVELVTGHKNTSTPVPTEVVSHKQNNDSNVSPLDNDSTTTATEIEKKVVPEVTKSKISEQKTTNVIETASNDETVSTTQIDQTNTIAAPVNSGIDSETEQIQNTNPIGQSAPDSTIIQNEVPDKLQANLPDSTMEIHSEVSSDVTSTLNDTEKFSTERSEPSQPQKEVSAMESFGNLLTMLKDKSKIKELLLMLGDQSGETEKIKKKLEKLSEIVSDEEDESGVKTSDKTLPDSQSITSDKVIEQTQSQEIDENITPSSVDEIGVTVKEPNSKNMNEDQLIKDVQPDNKDETKDLPGSMEENKVNNSNQKLPNDTQISDDQTNNDGNDDLESNGNQDEENNEHLNKAVPKKNNVIKRGRKPKRGKNNVKRVNKPKEVKSPVLKPKPKKNATNRELFSLQNDIKEMFMCDDVLNATGIRMCRLAKMIDKKGENDSPPKENEPVVLIEKIKGTDNVEEPPKKIRKKPGPKPKQKTASVSMVKRDKSVEKEESTNKIKSTYKPGPKSKTRQKVEAKDPYDFDTDSVADTNTTKESDANSSDSDSESLVSNDSFGSSEILADIKKKPKKKRGSWQTGVIKPRHRKKKELDSPNTQEESKQLPQSVTIPDLNCFTDKTYCFQRGVFTYDCRLCHYSGTEIVNHYKKQHAHTEVPLSRMDPDTAKKAIQQCEEINFQAISKIPSEKYTCRFCYKEFSKNRVALETFFWHVVSTHTGEYKHLCYECVNFKRCPFNLDIPPPPKEVKGQLIGYICGKCNFTQISLENLKTHVIVRHNDEQTEVYTINLGVVSQKAMKAMLRKSLKEEKAPRTLRSSRSNQSAGGSVITDSDRLSEDGSSVPKIEEPDPHVDATLAEVKRRIRPGPLKSKITFETDDQEGDKTVKVENEPESEYLNEPSQLDDSFNDAEPVNETHDETLELNPTLNPEDTFSESANDQSQMGMMNSRKDKAINKKIEQERACNVFESPHFKLNYKETGAKEYVCCINGQNNHYKTTLLISLKKHVQTKHTEIWDGYCYVCKVIVTLQGVKSSFKDCLAHFLEKHMDDFPVMEKSVENMNEDSRTSLRSSIDGSTERTESPRIFVRPLSDLITKDAFIDPPVCEDSDASFPVIENVVSLGDKTVQIPQSSPVYPSTTETPPQPPIPFQYEEVQAEVMSKKHRIVLDTMMPKELLVRVYKCSGRFCSFTSDSVEDSLVHASAHKQLGGEGSLDCAYCNFDAAGNAIDLVMHVFKAHGRCQYSCTMCFYRAAADQLVSAHFIKAHATTSKAIKVIRTTSVLASTAADSTNLLSRETAVPYYICNHGGGSCKFRTYTPGKFCEHLQQKHDSESEHPCNMCEVTMPTPAELVKHMKNHGVRLYQCTWCVHGANSEAEMLSHAASLHPTKNPQAYLRIITNKEGSTEKRVLPLIYLNKLKETVEDVTPSEVKENPTREAERSIELEKLITHMSVRVETDTNVSNPAPETSITEVPEVIAEPSDLADEQTVQAIEKSLLSSPEKASQAVLELVSVKNEPVEALQFNHKTEHVVYCLDSDEEESQAVEDVTPKPTVIDLSDEEPDKTEPSVLQQLVSKPAQKSLEKPKFKKLPVEALYKCPSCKQLSRNVGGFKKHTNVCCKNTTTMSCPHEPCPIILSNITQLINHYNKDHNALNINKVYHCGECKSRWTTLNVTKRHLKDAHGVVKVVITSKLENDGTCVFTIHKETREPERPAALKRKASVETPKKYGIEDIDKLPINPILDSLVYCNICEFNTKVRLNMVRHLQLHAERQPVPQTAPVNPVPHLETNEKHFDKMVNLASSSAAARADKLPAVPPEAIGRYPKYVPDRQRHTCGAKGCSYISVDEGMLRCHWETLHSAAVDYHCAHCPPHQHLDTSKLLTASRIIAHLKMHDVNLYACSACTYYHYKKQIVEKHVADNHKDRSTYVMVVREEGISHPVAQVPAAVGTMDLKSWQCGLCQYKSMLRRDLIEHCSKEHNTKMQYKCSYCPFRTSDIENITKHQFNAHPTKTEDVFYYYYREGDVPNDPDGTPRWLIQRRKSGLQTDCKTEVEPIISTKQLPTIDLNLVKKEVEEPTLSKDMTVAGLCTLYGEFCDPNGISFKCPLCKTAMEFKREAMQSHLYEELNYRRWSCAICMYKAYHKAGLNEHIASEHNRNYAEPTELPVDKNIEKWVSSLLDHQAAIIEKNKVPKMATEKPVPGPSKAVEAPKVMISSDSELEQAFGLLGSPQDDCFCCPKCNITVKDEDEMRNHLESELTKIRWCCPKCTNKFPTFHEAQFHCKSHPGPLCRPTEAIREPGLRTAWITSVINTQKKSMKPSDQQLQTTETESENSLLVVRYEEPVPTEEQLRDTQQDQIETRKRPVDTDSEDDDGMVICEPENKKINFRNCPYCDFVSKSNWQVKLCMKDHILRHYNLKGLTCGYCPFNSCRKKMYKHLRTVHPDCPQVWKQTEIPNVLPSEYVLKNKKTEKKEKRDEKCKVCLHCEVSVPEQSLSTHLHGGNTSEYGERGEVVVKCCICLVLTKDKETMQEHYKTVHPDICNPNYAFYQLQIDTREVQSCGICNRRFTFLRDLRIHHTAMHGPSMNLTFTTIPYQPEDQSSRKRKLNDTPVKYVAKKSTSKLPFSNIAKKSTTKLPHTDNDDEYSYYGTKPSSFNQYENVTTMMPMYNTLVEIDVKKLSGIIKMDPKVMVKDIGSSQE